MKSEILNLEYKIIDRNPNGTPIRIKFSDGIEYDREEMDLLKSATPETILQLHKIKSVIPGLIHKLDEVIK